MSEISEQVAQEHYEERRHWLDGKDRVICRCGMRIDCQYNEAAQKLADHVATETEILILKKNNPANYSTIMGELSRTILSMVHDHQPEQVNSAFQTSARIVTDRTTPTLKESPWVRTVDHQHT